ncbi:FxSxx-COOH cyclophane-containing RiPP peptide [Streptomyces soliscabiei]|uniref:FxSxx-COOH cyclophane-containing RiPP peptide n=1 Tax=Streptomyces soliscabiei TaxID=588897 RepID=UPI0029A8F0A8|nr:FxSxx-COOH cyclophane-containing RiPP peptide [Streptomyces sp. NY05-11A]MDX2682016.1 FxSxx-COOH protein [Streptomyces sp. NY05-11A]
MTVQDEFTGVMAASEGSDAAWEPLPDLHGLALAELATIEHPVLRDAVADLRDRSGQSSEPLWGFASAL